MDLGNLPARFTPKNNPLRFRQGTIVSVEADQCTLTVTIAGSTVPISGVRYATGVMPVPGLAVWLATDGRDLFAIATLMTTDATPWGYYVDFTFARGLTQPGTPTGDIPASPPWYGSPPSGTTPLWMSEATKSPQGVVVGSWSLPVQLTGGPGPSAPLLQIRYSLDGVNWHTTYTGTDVYISTSNDGGTTWSAAVRILGAPGSNGSNGTNGSDGAPGDPGAPGTPGAPGDPGVPGPQGIPGSPGGTGATGPTGPAGFYTVYAYKRAASNPGAPTGGSGTSAPSGWAFAPQTSNGNPLWMTTAYADGNTNALTGPWSTPVQLEGIGVKSFFTTPTVPYSVGDLWFSSGGGSGLIYRCATPKLTTGSYNIADWTALELRADYVKANVALDSPTITAGIITGAVLRTAAASVTRLVIAAVAKTIYGFTGDAAILEWRDASNVLIGSLVGISSTDDPEWTNGIVELWAKGSVSIRNDHSALQFAPASNFVSLTPWVYGQHTALMVDGTAQASSLYLDSYDYSGGTARLYFYEADHTLRVSFNGVVRIIATM